MTNLSASDTENTGGFKEKSLTVREHNDPDKHWIGESLAPPSQTEIAATVGTTSGPGDSPFAARADHTHKLDVAIFPITFIFAPSGNIDATTSSSFITWLISTSSFTVPTWAVSAVIQVNIVNVYALTAVPTGYAMDVVISTTPGGYNTDVGFIAFYQLSERLNCSFTRERTGFATGVQDLRIGVRRWLGTGGMRADTASRISGFIMFKPS